MKMENVNVVFPKIRCRGTVVTTKQTPDDNLGGKRGGFTLVELLVVVLIIGILAAVALPQYNKAVRKTHLTQWATYLNAYTKAIDLYLLENGYPASGTIVEFSGTAAQSGRTFVNLDIGLPCPLEYPDTNKCNTSIGFFHVGCSSSMCFVNIGRDNSGPYEYINTNKLSSDEEWNLNGVGGSDELKKLVCEWWKNNFGMNRTTETGVADCASVGVS